MGFNSGFKGLMQVTTIQIFTDLTNVKPGKSHPTRNCNNVTDLHKQQQERLRYSHAYISVVKGYFLTIKLTRCTNSSNLFLEQKTLHVSDRFSVHHQESSTVYTAIGICHTGYTDCLLKGSECSNLIPLASSQHNLYDINLLLCVQC